ncbi:MAG: ATP-dependent helicase [Candidatus Omnitrophica bacterium]|nr:ATP-dependent helicase [Candidatus Omnitrophota bacterium]
MKYTLFTDTPGSKFTDIDYQKELNPEQYKVVTDADGASLVLAGAGSGKTRTLVYRVAYLLNQGVSPQNILLVTFTNKAAHTMQDRVEMLLRAKPKGMWSGTFHHIGNRTLRIYAQEVGFKSDFGILDEQDAIDLLKVCIKNLNIKLAKEKMPTPKIIKKIISFSENCGLSISKTTEKLYPYFLNFVNVLNDIYRAYVTKKKTSNVMDYDDLLIKWRELLQTNPQIKQRFAEQFKYILVDEYQDTNKLQADIIRELSDCHKNVLVVGDDAQSIYSFRGADVSNILNFPNLYPDAKVFKLETNYRSTPEILDLANDSILHNIDQFDKQLHTVKSTGNRPALIELTDPHSQAAFIAQRTLELQDKGIPLKDISVLFRAHYQSAELQMELLKRNIPYIIRGGVRFFEQAHIKDVLSYLKILINPYEELAWVRSLGMHAGIGPGYATKIFDKFIEIGSLEKVLDPRFSDFLPAKAKAGFSSFRTIIKQISDPELLKRPDEIVKRIIENGYEDYVRVNFDNAKDRIDDIKELVNFAHQYRSAKIFLQDITLRESFKGESSLGDQTNDDEDVLVLSTIHQAKGLEWHTVFVIGLSEGFFPHSKAVNDEKQIEEERRLFYVAATRAKNELYLVRPITRFDYQMGTVIMRKSLFLQELDMTLYEKWDVEESKTDLEDFIELD